MNPRGIDKDPTPYRTIGKQMALPIIRFKHGFLFYTKNFSCGVR